MNWRVRLQRRSSRHPALILLPALKGFVLSEDNEGLRDMFMRLIATSMEARQAGEAHPAFVEVLKQLSPDEARIMALFVGPRKPVLWSAVVAKGDPEKMRIPTLTVHERLSFPAEDLTRSDEFELPCEDAGGVNRANGPAYVSNLDPLGLAFDYPRVSVPLPKEDRVGFNVHDFKAESLVEARFEE